MEVRILLDTNVFVSGVFFNGPPYRILSAWRAGRLRLVICREILEMPGEITGTGSPE